MHLNFGLFAVDIKTFVRTESISNKDCFNTARAGSSAVSMSVSVETIESQNKRLCQWLEASQTLAQSLIKENRDLTVKALKLDGLIEELRRTVEGVLIEKNQVEIELEVAYLLAEEGYDDGYCGIFSAYVDDDIMGIVDSHELTYAEHVVKPRAARIAELRKSVEHIHSADLKMAALATNDPSEKFEVWMAEMLAASNGAALGFPQCQPPTRFKPFWAQ